MGCTYFEKPCTFGKWMYPVIPLLCVKLYLFYSTRMHIASNNPWRLICHQTKKPLKAIGVDWLICLTAYQFLMGYLYIYPNRQPEHGPAQHHFFQKNSTGFYTKLSFSLTGCHTKVKISSSPYCLPIAGMINVGCWPLPR